MADDDAKPATKPAAKPTAKLLSGDVRTVLREMSTPMLVGLIAMILVNLIDTYWVSRLGTDALAAMTFTFPVASVVINVALGLMIGTSVAVARAVGGGHTEQARHLTTHATVLAVGIVAIISTLGLIFQGHLFRAMGAEGEMLVRVQEYMTPWFVGVAFLVVPMIANGALRAVGDPKTPSRVMIAAAVINAVLDPIFIFGWGPIPRLELQGAAVATVIARFFTMLVVFVVLLRNTDLLGFAGTTPRKLLASWWTVSRVAVPAMITNAVGPFALGLLTTMVAAHGPGALAAWGIGARINALVLMVPNALSGGLSPFVGQNWGAHLKARVADGVRVSIWFAVLWGTAAAAILIVAAPLLSSVFSDEVAVQKEMVVYLRTIPVAYAFMATVSMCASTFNAVDRATRSTLLSVMRSLLLALPLAWVGDQLHGFQGMMLGMVVATIATALLGVRWMRVYLWPMGDQPPGAGPVLAVSEVVSWFRLPSDVELTAAFEEVLGLDQIEAREVGRNRLGLFVGARELAHFKREGAFRVPLPVEVGNNLVRLGRLEHTPNSEDNGWYQAPMHTHDQVATVTWLVGMSHLLYELSQRGTGDPITQAELDRYSRGPECVRALTDAAARWDAVDDAA